MKDNEISQIKPFKQVPHAEADTMLSIKASEFEAIQNIINAFKSPLEAVKNVFDRNINEGNITIKYITQDGEEITKEEAEQYLQKASNYLKEQEKTPS